MKRRYRVYREAVGGRYVRLKDVEANDIDDALALARRRAFLYSPGSIVVMTFSEGVSNVVPVRPEEEWPI